MDELISACRELHQNLPPEEPQVPIRRHLKKNRQIKALADRVLRNLKNCGPVFQPQSPETEGPGKGHEFQAVAWNIERGKNLKEVQEILATHPDLKKADIFFFTEVDWGMVRSENRNVTAELGEALNLHAYFAPSYYNFTKGHGMERSYSGRNQLGLHGKSILTRYPLQNLRTVPMPNATDKLASREARLGQKRALLGDIQVGSNRLTLACAHLDAFSSPRMRACQLREVAAQCKVLDHVLLAGDWNTNTLDSTSTPRLLAHILYQILVFRPVNMVKGHHPFPERYFDKPLFSMLKNFGFDYESCNVLGEGTYDLLTNDRELGKMASDQYPWWVLKYINRLIKKAGGRISLKLDWFATKKIHCIEKRVVRLPNTTGSIKPLRASDHHPILIKFKIEENSS